MNSDLVDRLARAFALTTSIGGSLLRYIGIRRLNAPLPPTEQQRLARALGIQRSQVDVIWNAVSDVEVLLDPSDGSGVRVADG
jgi:hypothetical protein